MSDGQERPPGEKKPRWWRESKAALLATLASQQSPGDPMPEVPDCLLDSLWLVPKLNDIKAAQGGEGAAEQVEQVGVAWKRKILGPTAEPQLQLCADTFSETDRLDKYWKERAGNDMDGGPNMNAQGWPRDFVALAGCLSMIRCSTGSSTSFRWASEFSWRWTIRPPSVTGPHVESAGVHHDPSPGPEGRKLLYGHIWATLAVVAAHPLWGR